jgi:fatty-acyl-CoA synthase
MTVFSGPPLETAEGIGALTMGAFLDEVGELHASSEALVFDDPLLDGATVRWTYTELRRQASRVGRALVAAGIEPGERVGIVMANRPEAVASIFGIASIGAVAVPISTFAARPELGYMLQRADITLVLAQERLLGRRFGDDLAELTAEVPSLRATVVLGQPTAGADQLTWDDFVAAGDAVDPTAFETRCAAVTPDDDALVIFSSGTTSAPKGVLHGHRAPCLQFWLQAQLFGRHQSTRMWAALPLFWTAGLNTAMGATLAAGGCFVMQETFEPGDTLRLLERERVTEPYTLPHQAAALEEHADWATTDLSSLTCVFGKSAFARHPTVTGDTNWVMPVGYGLSESCAFFFSHRSDTPRELTRQSMGRLLPGNRLRIVDVDTGDDLGPGAIGELAIAGPTLMKRYLGKEPADCFDADGYFHTGDEGSVDADGYVHYEGRRTEMIKTGGANVSPAELEVQLRACPPVKLSRVLGVPDPRLDQIVVACITLKDGAHATEDDIRAFLRDRVAAYKVPKRVLFFADGEIPMTTSATKVRDTELLALVERRLADSSIPATTSPIPTTSGDR